jgi:RNA polymerase sigma factor (sigma-70 family)
VDERDQLAESFQEQRGQLLAVAYRMLGSAVEAEDAVQEAWLRLARVDPAEVASLPAWLRTVVTRICLDMLRSRGTRREDLTDQVPEEPMPPAAGGPEEEALLAESVSDALLLMLETLEPAQRVVLVLHDMFAVPFSQIAPIVKRTPAATKKLASRARHKVRGTPAVSSAVLAGQRRVVSEFLAAARDGDLPRVLAVLDPDVVRTADPAALAPGVPEVVRGARPVAEGTVLLAQRSKLAELALVNGQVGVIVAPGGRLRFALTFTVEGEQITAYTVIAAPERLVGLSVGVLP